MFLFTWPLGMFIVAELITGSYSVLPELTALILWKGILHLKSSRSTYEQHNDFVLIKVSEHVVTI